MDELVKLATARELVDAGAVKGAELVGLPGGWTIRLHTYARDRILASKLGEPRQFSTADSAVKVLQSIGMRTDALRMDASRWQPVGILSERRRRPDRAAALRRVHELAKDQLPPNEHQ